jgi:hypothetical protein
MDQAGEIFDLQERLVRWKQLAKEFPAGCTAATIRDMEQEIRDRIQRLERQTGAED